MHRRGREDEGRVYEMQGRGKGRAGAEDSRVGAGAGKSRGTQSRRIKSQLCVESSDGC